MPTLHQLTSDELDRHTVEELRRLWALAFADGFTAEDADHAFGGVHVLVRDGARVLAQASVVPRTLLIAGTLWNAGYVEGVATLPAYQGLGHGSRAMEVVNTVIRQRFDLGMLSTSRSSFYRRLGWEHWQGSSYVLSGTTRLRTAEEDAGLMALRAAPTARLELTASVACYDRPGDAW